MKKNESLIQKQKLAYAKKLEQAILRIRDRKEKIDNVFKKLNIPLKPLTYYLIKKRYELHGIKGLMNKSGLRPVKTTGNIRESIKKYLQENIKLKGKEIREKLISEYGVKISVSQINRVINQNELRPVEKEKVETIELEYAGAYIFKSAVNETNYLEIINNYQKELIEEKINELKSFPNIDGIYEEIGVFSKDEQGKFKRYREESEKEKHSKEKILSEKFKSVNERVQNRSLNRYSISKVSIKTIERKNMTLLTLPITTASSRFSELTDTRSNELKYISGYNYKTNTIDKYARELKYFQMSNELLLKTGEFCYDLWKKQNEELNLVCYYFDGHKKALWSSLRILQSKVPSVGRVMGCLEQVFVHNTNGNPIMLQTFPGGIYLPKAIKELTEKLNKFLPEVEYKISIFDGGGNSIEFYESFGENNYFICILDNNQYKQDLSNFEKGEIIKKDNEEFIEATKFFPKNNIDDQTINKNKDSNTEIKLRTPLYKNENKKEKYIAFVTNIPKEKMTSEEIVRLYYRRWPAQEFDIRNMSMGSHLKTNYGFGKIKIINYVVQKKILSIKEKIQKYKDEIINLEQTIKNLEDSKQNNKNKKNCQSAPQNDPPKCTQNDPPSFKVFRVT